MNKLKALLASVILASSSFVSLPTFAGDTLDVRCYETETTRVCRICFNGNCRYELDPL